MVGPSCFFGKPDPVNNISSFGENGKRVRKREGEGKKTNLGKGGKRSRTKDDENGPLKKGTEKKKEGFFEGERSVGLRGPDQK